MACIPNWLPIASVGKPDEQHIVLLVLGRSLLAALATYSANSLLVRDILADIENQFQEDNILEEQTLKANACPTLNEHRVDHQDSIESFAKLLDDASQGQCEKVTVFEVINEWLNYHILENDLPVTRYMRSH